MKVKDLIKELSKVSPAAEVRLHDKDGTPLLWVNWMLYNKGNVVWFETAEDIDVKEEIRAMMKEAMNNGNGEEDWFYNELYRMGFTIEMMRTYVGDSEADAMELYYKEHGFT